MKQETPEKLYLIDEVGTNGFSCLDYRNFDTDIEYIRSDIANKRLQEARLVLISILDSGQLQTELAQEV